MAFRLKCYVVISGKHVVDFPLISAVISQKEGKGSLCGTKGYFERKIMLLEVIQSLDFLVEHVALKLTT